MHSPGKKLSFSSAAGEDDDFRHFQTTAAAQHHDPNATLDSTMSHEGMPSSSSSTVRVYLRMRPSKQPQDDTLHCIDHEHVRAVAPLSSQAYKNGGRETMHAFTRVFCADTDQKTMFEIVGKPMVENVVMGNGDGLIFAYGVTNSGKTYTVNGTMEQPGLIPRALEICCKDRSVGISVMEVYNDQVHDLTDPPIVTMHATDPTPPRRTLKVKLREEGVLVEGLRETIVRTAAEGLAVLKKAEENRVTTNNNLNATSSRSHSVFLVRVGDCRLFIVDLAGSERGKRTGASGTRQQEASNINLSLSQLMQCLDALRYNQKLAKLYPDKPQNQAPFRPVPFRGSKLTLLFRDCLRGRNCGMVAMIVNASTEPADFDETALALKYGEACKLNNVEAQIGSSSSGLAAASQFGDMKYDYHGRLVRITGAPPAAAATAAAAAAIVVPAAVTARPIPTFPDSLAPPSQPNATIDMMEENERLRREHVELTARLVTLEVEIRDQVAKEMSEQLAQMQERNQTRMDRERGLDAVRVEALQMSVKKQQRELGRLGGLTYTLDDLKAVAEQIDECEEEMERMREAHKSELERINEAHANEVEALRSQLHAMQRAQILQRQGSALVPEVQHPKTPAAVAEERKRVDRLMRDLDDERNAHRAVLMERAEMQEYLDRTLAAQAASSEREAILVRDMQALKDELDVIKARLLTEEKTTYALKSLVNHTATSQPGSSSSSSIKRKSPSATTTSWQSAFVTTTTSSSSTMTTSSPTVKKAKEVSSQENEQPNQQVTKPQRIMPTRATKRA